MNIKDSQPDHEGDAYFDRKLYKIPEPDKKRVPPIKIDSKPIVPGTPEWEEFKRELKSKK